MKPTRKDRRQDFLMTLLKPLVRVWMKLDMKTSYVFHETFDPKRKEPYVLIANHTFLFDVVHVPLPLKKVPFIVASHNLFIKQPTKLLLTQIAHAIPKTKNASDIRTARELIGAVKRGYPVAIFPEGNTTFNGETTYIEAATMKLIKKLKIDVVTVKVEGGYLSKPRWATGKRKNRRATLNYKVAIPKERLKDLTIEQINDIVNEELYHNDYEYQRRVMVPHPGKDLAEGIENILYVCPECESFGTLETHLRTIRCNACGAEGNIDDYGFIHGFRFDNTVDWDHWQRQFDRDILNHEIASPCVTYLYDDHTFRRTKLGKGTVTYKNKQLILTGEFEAVFDFADIKVPIITLRREFNINVGDKHYVIVIDQYITSFLRAIQDKY